jgi:hypothetical protein
VSDTATLRIASTIASLRIAASSLGGWSLLM